MTLHASTRSLVTVIALACAAAACARRTTRHRPPPPAPRWKHARRTARTSNRRFAGQTRAPALKSSFTPQVSVVASGLKGAWAFEFLPDGRILVTERSGNLRIVDKDGKVSAPADRACRRYSSKDRAACSTSRSIRSSPPIGPSTGATAEPREGWQRHGARQGRAERDRRHPPSSNVQVIFRQMPTLEVQPALRLAHRLHARRHAVPGPRRAFDAGMRACIPRTCRQPLRQGRAPQSGRQRAEGQSVRRPQRREAGDLVLRPSQHPGRDARSAGQAVDDRTRPARRRRAESTASRARTTAGRSSPTASSTPARRSATASPRRTAWSSRSITGIR